MKVLCSRCFCAAGLLSLLVASWLGIADAQARGAYPGRVPDEKVLMDDERICLAMNIYHEARGESKRGKLAVAAVTMNRVKSPKYPDTICEVVWQPYQFSWTLLPKKLREPAEPDAWKVAIKIARDFVKGGKKWKGVGNATLYHNQTVRPDWSRKGRLVARVGRHRFYTL